MSVILDHFKLDFMPMAAGEAVVQVGSARFTVLTERLFRMEYHPEACFEDHASQAFWYRHQPVPNFSARTTADGVEIETQYLLLKYQNGAGFTPENLSIVVKATDTTWHPGDVDEQNLRGTTRTLDFINGYTPLGQGLMSRAGWSLLDDSASLVFNETGWLEPRVSGGVAGGARDWYFFGYGHDYKACLRDYCEVSGKVPMIPRWILGNWWSRYWAYTQEDLTSLIHDFEANEMPFSVCIVDMDWHLTETNNKSTGWTGYTWNRKLFPDPKGFIDFAHDKGLKIALNLHPAEGIHSHEEQYAEMALRIGIDPETLEAVMFDITNPAFVQAYFEVLHHPYEKMGIDFWWVDWQQGLKSAMPGLDPLWLINHTHFYDLGREGTRRPFIFSRWGNEGHQRYPIGFSGDSYITWDTLAFEAYMTPTASNIAYGWWSHDIGGHTSGVEDRELFTRWIQFGVFSPINRIHATKGLYYDRRPWIFENAEAMNVGRDALQLRHALIPYLYTMARRAHDDSLPLMQPMYYEYPEAEEAYQCPHQYFFGTELIVAPFVTPADDETGMSRQVVWLPEGDWYNFLTGEHFAGNRWHAIYGALADIPLFAKAGAIIPLGAKTGWGGVENPNEFHVHIFAGADGNFTIYEDDGETTAYFDDRFSLTTLSQKWHSDSLEFTIDSAQGDTSLIPSSRSFKLIVHGVSDGAMVQAEVDSSAVDISITYDADAETLTMSGIELAVTSSLVLKISAEKLLSHRNRKRETILRMLKFFKLHTGVRNDIARQLDAILVDPTVLAPYVITMSQSQGRALFEVLYEAGVHHIADTYDPNLIVMWNNQENAQITYRFNDAYLFFGSVRHASYVNGVVPRFSSIAPPVHSWSHGAQGEHVHRTQWHAQIDYFNIFTAVVSHREVSP